MKKRSVNRSPLFYVGDKYKLISEIKTHFPPTIGRFIEPFVGGGSVFLNVEAQEYLLNDLDSDVIALHQFLCSQNQNEPQFFAALFKLIDDYGLSCSYRRDEIPQELKSQFKKTYFARFNKENFARLKADFNLYHRANPQYLYVLLIYGFNRMLRFNSRGEYNLPVGNVDFNQNTYDALEAYFSVTKSKQLHFFNQDFNQFFADLIFRPNDLVYLDPPYLITFSEYNKLWNEDTERALLAILDNLDSQNVKFAISNVTHYKGRINSIFLKWAEQYNSHPIKSKMSALAARRSSSDDVLRILAAPTRLEFLTALAIKSRLPHVRVIPNYIADDTGLPTSTAGGGIGDIECFEPPKGILVEVTMAEGRAQTMMEIWPIERHLIEFKEKHTDDSECIFVAPSIFPDSQRQIEFVRDQSRGQNVIRPYKIADFVDYLETAQHLFAKQDL